MPSPDHIHLFVIGGEAGRFPPSSPGGATCPPWLLRSIETLRSSRRRSASTARVICNRLALQKPRFHAEAPRLFISTSTSTNTLTTTTATCAQVIGVADSAQAICPSCRQMVFVLGDKIIHRTVGMRFLPF